jgi:HD-GYP domain-containing protein (c-di-GMP phosphodiesterase class II)
VGAICALSLTLLALAWAHWGSPPWGATLALFILSVVSWWVGTPNVTERVYLSFSGAILLTAAALTGPVGAALLGWSTAALQRERLPMRARIVNSAMSGIVGVVGGVTYLAAGGGPDVAGVRGIGSVLVVLVVPVLVADLAQVAANAILLASVTRVAQGVPIPLQLRRLLQSTGPAYLAQGIIGLLLILLWKPAGLGWASVFLIVAPLLGGRWALGQYAAEQRAEERSLDALVGAIEVRAPHLEGHCVRVANLSAAMAEALGMSPRQVTDIRRGGMLHDLGLVTVPPDLVREVQAGSPENPAVLEAYTRRSRELLGGLSFLNSVSSAIVRLERAPHREALLALAAEIVRTADLFDLLTEVGIDTRDAYQREIPFRGDPRRRLTVEEAIAELRHGAGPRSRRVIEALQRALQRPRELRP